MRGDYAWYSNPKAHIYVFSDVTPVGHRHIAGVQQRLVLCDGVDNPLHAFNITVNSVSIEAKKRSSA